MTPLFKRRSMTPLSTKIRLTTVLLILTSGAPALADPEFVSIKQVGEQDLWGFTRGGVYLSHDLGTNWTQVTPKFSQKVLALSGFALGEKQAWLTVQTEQNTLVYRTETAGETWESSSLSGVAQGSWLKFSDPQQGIALVGLDAGMSHQAFLLFRTQDGGVSWKKVNSSKNGYFQVPELKGGNLPDLCCLQDGLFLNDQSGFVSGTFGVQETPYFFRTVNGGKTFQSAFSSLPLKGEEAKAFSSFEIPYAKGETVVLSGTFRPANAPPHLVVFLSQDRGKSWVRGEKLNPKEGPGLSRVVFTDAKNGYAWLSGKLYRTSTAGQTWHDLNVPFQAQDLIDMSFADPQHGLALLEHLFYTTRDGGESWQETKR